MFLRETPGSSPPPRIPKVPDLERFSQYWPPRLALRWGPIRLSPAQKGQAQSHETVQGARVLGMASPCRSAAERYVSGGWDGQRTWDNDRPTHSVRLTGKDLVSSEEVLPRRPGVLVVATVSSRGNDLET